MAKLFGVQPVAMRYDGKARDFLVNANGTHATCHPIDQQMMLGLCAPLGSMRSTPEIGNGLHHIEYLGNPNLQAEVEHHVRTANPIAQLLANGDVVIDLIRHETTSHGGLLVAVHYRNMRRDKKVAQTITNQG